MLDLGDRSLLLGGAPARPTSGCQGSRLAASLGWSKVSGEPETAVKGKEGRPGVSQHGAHGSIMRADILLRDLRAQGRVPFAAVDTSILETAPEDQRGAIVLETEMDRAASPDGEDWGVPSWRRSCPGG